MIALLDINDTVILGANMDDSEQVFLKKILESNVLNEIFEHLLKCFIEYTQAEKGVFILNFGGNYKILGELLKDSNSSISISDEDLTQRKLEFPLSVFAAVFEKKIPISLLHTQEDVEFANDLYLQKNQNVSLICLPLLYLEKCIALIYVENCSKKSFEAIAYTPILLLISKLTQLAINQAINYAKIQVAFEDISQEKLLLQESLLNQDKLASLGFLTASIAHELKNPLNFIINFSTLSLEILDNIKIVLNNYQKKNDENTPYLEMREHLNELKENVETIYGQGIRSNEIIHKMLELGNGDKQFVPTDIQHCLEDCISLSYHGMRVKNSKFYAKFVKNYDPSLDKIDVIPHELSRVFINLLANCYYALNEKKEVSSVTFEPTITIETKKIGDYCEIKIRDNGKGIPANVIEKIFVPFFTTKQKNEGTGIGLSLSKRIIEEMHKGKLVFNTKEGEYTEFVITIPLHQLQIF